MIPGIPGGGQATPRTPHCVPAYGRDYTSMKAIVEAWMSNVDFRIEPSGSYISRSSAEEHGAHEVNLRWKRFENVCVMTFVDGQWRVNGRVCKAPEPRPATPTDEMLEERGDDDAR